MLPPLTRLPKPVVTGLAILVGAASFACHRASGPDGSVAICDGTPPPEAESLCGVHAAVERTRSGDAEAAASQCATLSSETWRGECHFQIAEAQATMGDRAASFASCDRAGAFSRMCHGHTLWITAESLVDAGPGSANAQQLVDSFVVGLPQLGGDAAARELSDIARSAAWHGIYAGAGSADPTAARSARPTESRYAIGAFAWEATRLLGRDVGTVALLGRVRAMWWGGELPVVGAPQAQACWEARMMPRVEMDAPLWLPSVRTYPGNARFYDEVAEVDLMIATLDAAWVQGWEHDVDVLLALRGDRSTPVQKTVARQLGFVTEGVPVADRLYPQDGAEVEELRRIFSRSRGAMQGTFAARAVVPRDTQACK